MSPWRLGWFAFPLVLLAQCGREEPPREPLAQVIAASDDSLLAIPGVVGVYEGLSGDEPVIRVMILARADSIVRRLPKRLGGYRVELEAGGAVIPLQR
jgi:hypothetical protein